MNGFSRSSVHPYDNKNNRPLENGSGIYAVEIYRALEACATSGSTILIIRPSVHRSLP